MNIKNPVRLISHLIVVVALIAPPVVYSEADESFTSEVHGPWFEQPPSYYYQWPDRTLISTDSSLQANFQAIPPSEFLGFGATRILDSGFAMRRITNNIAGFAHGVHRYSKHQVWNANETVLDIGDRLIDAVTLEVVKDSVELSSARNWSYTNPNLLYGIRYVDGVSNVLASYNYLTGEHHEKFRFDQHEQCTFGSGEGNLSIDERRLVVACVARSTGSIDLLSVDLQQGVLLGKISAKANYNWVSFSQSGQYIVVENSAEDSGLQTELVRYAPDFSGKFVLSQSRHHGDLGFDVNGDDVLVMIDWDYISYIRLRDGVRVNLGVSSPTTLIAGHGHISCRNVRRPGWCYFSSYGRDLVGAVKIAQSEPSTKYVDNDGHEVLTGVAVVEIWGYHSSNSGSYQAAPKVTVSPTGSRVVFSSDWYGTSPADDYMINFIE